MKIFSTHQIKESGVSHNPDIKKKVFLENGLIPKLTTFAQATFTPGQSVDTHKHDTMHEVFYVQSGKAEFVIAGKKFLVQPGDCITIDPGEEHSQSNPFSEPVTWLYFGIATD